MDEKKNRTGKDIWHEVKRVWHNVAGYILAIEGINYELTIDAVKKDMVFRGQKAWILIFSIFIASIGLNANSIPVIIGAMLISPLMGPIVAIGMSLGTHDFDTLKRAFKNLAIAVSISLLVSAFYFWLTPLKEAKSELLARTTPTILDVLIALMGGLAGIIAVASRERGNVIPGVAIATALMPPLCTAGYGLATLQGKFFFGALYLFFINSVFISLATFIAVKYLKFPVKKIIEKETEKKLKRWMYGITILVIIPSAYMFFIIIKQSHFNTNAELFIQKEVKPKGSELLSHKIIYNDTAAVIQLYFIGKPVEDKEIDRWREKLKFYNLTCEKKFFRKLMLPDTTYIQVYQAKDDSEKLQKQFQELNQTLKNELRVGVLEEIYEKNQKIIEDKDQKIKLLENELIKYKKSQIPMEQLKKEIEIQYPQIKSFAYGQTVKIVNDSITDTIPTFIIDWKYKYNYYKRRSIKDKLSKWLTVRFDFDTVSVIENN